jgi:hypothetical protein
MRSIPVTATWAAIVLSVSLFAPCFSFADARFEGAIFSDVKGSDTTQETFSPDTRRIFLSVHVEDMANGAKLTATWFVEKSTGFAPNSKIASSDVTTRPQMKTANFSIDKPSIGWPLGDYKVELAIDGKVQSTVRFKVAR